MSVRVAVFASGGGTNLQALIDRLNSAGAEWGRVVLVVSDRHDAGALQRARAAAISTAVIPASGSEEDSAREMLAVLAKQHVDVIALAGYLRLVPATVVATFRDRIVNIHPALLPAFGGKGMYGIRVHRAVLEKHCTVTGVTVHHVDERYDEGRVIAQWPVPVLPDDTPESLAARVLPLEHLLYPLALEKLARRMAGSCGEESSPLTSFIATSEPPTEAMLRKALNLDEITSRNE